MNDQEKSPDNGAIQSYNHTSFLNDTKYKLPTVDWLYNVPKGNISSDIVEVRFKNTRKGFFYNVNHLRLRKGDLVAVEASPGHDIGIVSLT